jgi:hypothetical protein
MYENKISILGPGEKWKISEKNMGCMENSAGAEDGTGITKTGRCSRHKNSFILEKSINFLKLEKYVSGFPILPKS